MNESINQGISRLNCTQMDHGKGRMCGSRCLLQWELLFSSYLLFSTFVPIFLLIRVDQKLLILSSIKKKKRNSIVIFLFRKLNNLNWIVPSLPLTKEAKWPSVLCDNSDDLIETCYFERNRIRSPLSLPYPSSSGSSGSSGSSDSSGYSSASFLARTCHIEFAPGD